MSPDLSVVIVNWNVCDLLHDCLASVFAEAEAPGAPRLEVIVVDNGSCDGSVEMVRDAFPNARLVHNRVNRGFPAANNQGIALAQGRTVLLLNPDTVVVEGALDALVAYMDAHGDVGMVGPQLLNADGTVQSSRRRFPTVATLFLESTWLQPYAPRRILDAYYVADRSPDQVQDVDWLYGAALLVRREALLEVGPLDEGFFMYSEELDWCRRFKEAGWRVVYLPSAQVVHYGGRSSDQVVASRHIHFQTSKVRYTRKYHGRLAAGLLRWFLLASYAWQLLLEAGKWLWGHRRRLRVRRLNAYIQVLWSGLCRRS